MSTSIAPSHRVDDSRIETSDFAWAALYRIGGYAALLAVAVVLVEAIAVAVVQVGWLNSGRFGASTGGQPGTILGWFELFGNNRLAGLLDDAALDIAVAALLVPLFLALSVALRRTNEAWTACATALAVVGVAAYVATNTSFSLLFAADEYAAATTAAQRSLFLAAGSAAVAVGGGGLFFSAGFILVAVAGLIVAGVMLRGEPFGKATAWLGVAANGLLLADYGSFLFVRMTSAVSTALVGGGSLLLFVWWIVIARRLLHLGRGMSREPAVPAADRLGPHQL